MLLLEDVELLDLVGPGLVSHDLNLVENAHLCENDAHDLRVDFLACERVDVDRGLVYFDPKGEMEVRKVKMITYCFTSSLNLGAISL